MNYYVFTYTDKNGEQKELRLRLTSSDSIEIENIHKKSITSFIQEESMNMICTMLRYLRKWEDKNFSFNQAQKLYDELIDSGMTMKRILTDVIYEALVVSGFLEKEEWEEMKRVDKKIKDKTMETLLQE